jgi:hypothetical protein
MTRHPEPCDKCQTPTFGTFGSRPYCLKCLSATRERFRKRIAARTEPVAPEYAPGILRCDQCGAIRPLDDDWFELCSHGGNEPPGTDDQRCSGRMKRVTIREAERLNQTDGVA